jgi:signal peptidase I
MSYEPTMYSAAGAPAERTTEQRPRLHRPGFLRDILETLILIGLVYTLVNLATVRFYIEGPSMQPTFYAEQFLIVSRLHYLFGEPARGDIVVFDAPGDDNTSNNPLLIKRLIGLPGDHIQIIEGQVFVNGTLLNEPYLFVEDMPTRCNGQHCDVVLCEGQYYLMGDHRGDSKDSRSFGPVSRDRIVGEAVVRYWPLNAIGIVQDIGYPQQDIGPAEAVLSGAACEAANAADVG